MKKLLAILTLNMLAGPMIAHAGLLGAQVNWTYDLGVPFTGSQSFTVVDPGTELSVCVVSDSLGVCQIRVDADFNDNGFIGSIMNSIPLSTGFSQAVVPPGQYAYDFLFPDSRTRIVGISAIAATNPLNTDCSFTNTVITCNTPVYTLDPQQSYDGSFIIRTSTVPSPATLALFSLGLASLGWSRRKKA